ncbi:MAG: hypothetical protein WC656_07000 [Sulfurimonas sp.]
MLNENDYEVLKKSFVESQRLFDKLNRVANQAADINYDSLGLYLEEEETCKRHWLTLSSKIVDALSHSLDGYNIELLKNKDLELRELTLNLHKEEENSSQIKVDYSEDGSLSILQMS